MLRNLRTQNVVAVILICIYGSTDAQNTASEVLALNAEPSVKESSVSDITNYTSTSDITATNYFQLTGKIIEPYMAVKNVKKEYEVVKADASEKISLRFGAKSVEYNIGGETYEFVVSGLEQYFNNSPKCLVRGKIEVSCEEVKIGKENIDNIAIYFDQNNHISYIEVGDTELYLRP